MILTMTKNTQNHEVVDINFVGDEKDLVECIFHLIKLYKKEFEGVGK